MTMVWFDEEISDEQVSRITGEGFAFFYWHRHKYRHMNFCGCTQNGYCHVVWKSKRNR